MNNPVSKTVVEQRKEHFRNKCRIHRLRLTPQKSSIFETLATRADHPTAIELYESVKKIFPTLSFATVYKNLSLFAQKGLITELDFGEGYKRYDAHLEDHHHIYHSQLKKVEDVFLPPSAIIPLPETLQKTELKSIRITYVL